MQYGVGPPAPIAGSSGLPMDLRATFLDAIAAHRCMDAAHGGALVVLIASEDWRAWQPQAMMLVDGRELERVLRKRRVVDRELTTFAYACHRLLLAEVLGMTPDRVPLQRDALGCPRLGGVEAWTSLSHSDGLIALAVSMVGPVGVDIEPLTRAAEMREIAARVAHPHELAALSRLPESEQPFELLALWVRKEALLKAAGIGLACTMESFEAPPDTRLSLPGNTDGPSPRMRIHMLGDAAGGIAAAAVPDEAQVRCAWLRPGH